MGLVGARQLRADLAAHLRRAAAGEIITVTVDGTPAAVLGPLTGGPDSDIAALVASGGLVPPRRTDRPAAPEDPLTTLVTIRPDAMFRGLR